MSSSSAQTASPRPARKLVSRLSLLAGAAIAVAIFAWFGKGIVENWDELSAQLRQLSVVMLLAAAALQLAFNLFTSLCYYYSLRLAGADVRARDGVSAYLASQLGKYLPGKVFYVAGHIGLGKWLRIPVARIAVGFMAHHIQLLSMALLIASPLLGIALGRVAAIAVIVLAVAGVLILVTGVWVKPFNMVQRKRGKSEMETFSPTLSLRALSSAVIGWLCYACVVAIVTASMLGDASLGVTTHVGAAAVAAWALGFLSFVTPAGMGVREGAFVVLTQGVVPEPTAMAVAVTVRLIYTGLQVPTGAIALAFASRGRPEAN